MLLLNPQLLCKDNLVVHLNTRCALHGLIYLWDLKSTTKSLTEDTKKDKIIEKEVRFEISRKIFQQENSPKLL